MGSKYLERGSAYGDFDRMQKLLQKRQAQEQERRRELAWQKAREVAEFLRSDHGAARVLLYGSLARGDFHQFSDIDLYVEGFTGPYWRMLAKGGRLASPFDISVVCAEDARPSLKEAVSREGVELP